MDFGELILTALALVLVLEGLIYGLLAGWIKGPAVALLNSVSAEQIRWVGLTVAAIGVLILWLLHR